MTSAALAGGDDVTAIYSANVTAGAFSAPDFESFPSAETGTVIAQEAANELRITMSGSPVGDTTLKYSGTDPPAITPQTIAY